MPASPPSGALARRLPTLVLALAALGCASEPATAQAAPAPAPASTPPAPAPQRTIRFGDAARAGELEPFFPGTTYDERVPAPDAHLRQPLGTFTAHHAEIVAYLRALEGASDRIRVVPMGRTHEGRELVYAIVAAPEHLRRIDAIRAGVAKLADPRGVADAEVERIAASSPAIAWLGYSIHGDEMSGADASMAVAHHLVAGTSADVLDLLREVVVLIDPAQNPDGRERILSMLEQGAGYVPNLDVDSMSRGRWPWGRGNHYLFDMNRDWLWGTQPETRARWAAIAAWHPQLLVDAHEMGALDTYLFYPATPPFTPHFPDLTVRWWQRYGADQAAAFDAHGWSYYTREWADSWYPGYTDSWGTFQGAVGILYEQARFQGQAIRRASGEIATYRDAVRRQAVASLANLGTLARNRAEILRDYAAAKRANGSEEAPGNDRTYVLVPGRHPAREAELVAALADQGIEVFRAEQAFTAEAVVDAGGAAAERRELPAGCVLVPARQPLAPMVKAYLEFDPRYDQAALDRERKELERKQRSRAYDVTAWSPTHAFDLDALWCRAPDVERTRIASLPEPDRGVVPATPAGAPVYGWAVDGADDLAVAFAARALEAGLRVQLGDEPFRAAGRSFARWSLLVRRHENEPGVEEQVAALADETGVRAWALGTARSPDEGPDLGGPRFHLLARPRVALLSNTPIDTDAFGHVWHLFDARLGVPTTLVDAQSLSSYDLRRYNVLLVPDGSTKALLREHAERLQAWVRAGGTLVASGNSAGALCDPDLGLSRVQLRRDVLDDLPRYAEAVARERAAGSRPVDPGEVWLDEEPPPAAEEPAEPKKEERGGEKGEAAERRDAWERTFRPQGVFLRGEVNPDLWITAGCRAELPVYFEGSRAHLSELPVRTAVRFAPAPRVRLSGLLWPEARARIADSAYCTVERLGSGQVILFAAPPEFRGWTLGTARLLANAVVYGPGAGADQPLGW